MQNSSSTSPEPTADSQPTPASAHRLSAVELGAQRGIGPMSPQGLKVWHGESYPCVSCGELVRRSAIVCDQCGQDLSLRMIVKMQAHAGPWYVHEHVRPFPGVTLERLVRQAQRGILTATTIVRGPTTFHQWRFAAETPGLSKHLGVCWNCQGRVSAADMRCPQCRVDLDRPAGIEHGAPASPPPPPPASPVPAGKAPTPAAQPAAAVHPASAAFRPAPATGDLEQIRAALGAAPAMNRKPARGLPVGYIIAVILILAIGSLLMVVRMRQQAHPKPQATPVATPLIIPGHPPTE
ncbi:MAG TPA: hypothetical protein P5572_11810 [Phycisphaerae bacterium]|nr:hypothetical protein [Phycisphaerae bacterium]